MSEQKGRGRTDLFIVDHERDGDFGVVGPGTGQALLAVALEVAVEPVVGMRVVGFRHVGS